MALVSAEPEKATELASRALKFGIRPSMVSFMLTLRKQNQALADELYQRALQVTIGQGQHDFWGLLLLGSYVIPDLPVPVRILADGGSSPANMALARTYLSVLIDLLAIPERPATSDTIRWLPSPATRHQLLTQLRPFMARYAPEKVLVLEVAQKFGYSIGPPGANTSSMAGG